MTSALQIWKLDIDPTDAIAPYTAYTFTSAGRTGIAKGSMTRDFARRESVLSVPRMDGVLDGYGRLSGPMDRRDFTVTFTVFTDGHNDAAWDLLMAQVASGVPVRLVYTTDGGGQWFTVASNPRIQNTDTSDNRWGAGGEVNFVVTWRIRPYWTPLSSESAQLFHSGTTFAAGTTFGGAGTTVIAANPQTFTIDARGTAGIDLPTIPDTGPLFAFHGPCGGSLGFVVANFSADERDTNGALAHTQFIVPFPLPTSADSATLDFARQTFSHNGASFRPLKPTDSNGLSYQRDYFRVVPGVLNSCQVAAYGTGALTGGSIRIDWWRRRA